MHNQIEQTIYECLPTPIYRFLSDIWHRLLNYSHSLHEEGIDESTIAAAKLGFTLGILLTTWFIFFPGTKEYIDFVSSPENDENSNVNSQTKCSDTKWAGDDLPPELLERTRKKFNLTQEQMDQVLQKSKKEGLSKIDNDDGLSVSQTINATVYLLIICVLIYFINRDYDNAVTKLFVYYFPREAETLGIDIGKALLRNG